MSTMLGFASAAGVRLSPARKGTVLHTPRNRIPACFRPHVEIMGLPSDGNLTRVNWSRAISSPGVGGFRLDPRRGVVLQVVQIAFRQGHLLPSGRLSARHADGLGRERLSAVD